MIEPIEAKTDQGLANILRETARETIWIVNCRDLLLCAAETIERLIAERDRAMALKTPDS